MASLYDCFYEPSMCYQPMLGNNKESTKHQVCYSIAGLKIGCIDADFSGKNDQNSVLIKILFKAYIELIWKKVQTKKLNLSVVQVMMR